MKHPRFKADEYEAYKEYWENFYGAKLKHYCMDGKNIEFGDIVTDGVHCSGVWCNPVHINEDYVKGLFHPERIGFRRYDYKLIGQELERRDREDET